MKVYKHTRFITIKTFEYKGKQVHCAGSYVIRKNGKPIPDILLFDTETLEAVDKEGNLFRNCEMWDLVGEEKFDLDKYYTVE